MRATTVTPTASATSNSPLLVERRPVEDDLSRLTRSHRLEAALEFLDREVVRDHWRDVEPRLQHGRHLVPGLEHLAAVDAAHVEPLEDHLVPVDGGLARRNAEQRHA